MIFPFPEEGCLKAYSHFWYLQAHLDTGRHEMVVEHETLYDKAGKLYASKLSEGNARIPILESDFAVATEEPRLPMGCALKTIKKKVRFTDKQKQFLTEEFNNGEETGRKSDPQEDGLSENMEGARRFKPDEVLSAQQITGLFGRLAAKKKQVLRTVLTSEGDGGDVAAEMEIYQSDLCTKVLQEISLKHPVVSGTFNVCDLVRSDKLKRLTIDELIQICSDLEVDVSDLLSKRRKKPFIQ